MKFRDFFRQAKAWVALAFLAIATSSLQAAPTLAAGWVTNTASSGSALTVAITVTNGSNRCLIVSAQNNSGRDVTGVTFGGVLIIEEFSE